MSQTVIDGLSASLQALHTLLTAGPACGNAAQPVIRECLANHRLAAFVAECQGVDSQEVASRLFPEPPASGTFEFEPMARLMSEEEKAACIEAAARCIRDGAGIYGPDVDEAASHLGEFLGLRHVVLTSSGTAALTVALLALGVGQGHEVVMPANSFAATENAVLTAGATPVLADVLEGCHTLDPESVEAALTPRTRAILPVDLCGVLAPLAPLKEIASRHGAVLLEDACQAFGVDGVGQTATVAALSFNSFKNLAACGKAGALVTNDPDLARRAAMTAYHGFIPGRKMDKRLPLGVNALIDNLQAATLLARLPWASCINFRRLFLAMRYNQAFAALQKQGRLRLPPPRPDHAWHLYTLVLPDRQARDGLAAFLQAAGVPCKVVYPWLTHQQQSPLRTTIYRNARLPVTEDLQRRKLSLPLFNGLSLAEQDQAIQAVLRWSEGPESAPPWGGESP